MLAVVTDELGINTSTSAVCMSKLYCKLSANLVQEASMLHAMAAKAIEIFGNIVVAFIVRNLIAM
jgi:hypothetical protein